MATWNRNFYTVKTSDETIDYRDTGANGAAMRIAPLALIHYDRPQVMMHDIFCNSIVTHAHPRAILGAMLYGQILAILLQADHRAFQPLDYVAVLGGTLSNWSALSFFDEALIEWQMAWDEGRPQRFAETYAATQEEVHKHLQAIYRALREDKEPFSVLKGLGCFHKATKGAGTLTVVAGLYLAMRFWDNVKQAIVEAVNMLGTDTDSIAAFTGGMLGALHGSSAIPPSWQAVQDHSYITEMAERLYRMTVSPLRSSDERQPQSPDGKTVKALDKVVKGERFWLNSVGGGYVERVRQENVLTPNKHVTIVDVRFDCGMTARFSKVGKGRVAEFS